MDKKIFERITKHLLEDEKPSKYMNEISKDAIFNEYPLELLKKLKSTEQSKKHHPEGNAWNHTMLVLDEAAKVREESKDPKAFMWAALLHDIGKPGTTRIRKGGRITSYDHDKVGADLCVEFLSYFTEDEEFMEQVRVLVRYHMHMLYVLKDLPYGDNENMIRKADIHELALLCKCDRLGRTGADEEAEEREYQQFIKELKKMKENILV
ncbi:MAG TPA: HDIG domain-containing protein [Clostridiales bacterium]|nr:HDIG domain-containing protein [Clostridiales bacterium]